MRFLGLGTNYSIIPDVLLKTEPFQDQLHYQFQGVFEFFYQEAHIFWGFGLLQHD